MELIILTGLTFSGLLFSLGGMYEKAIRRYLMPLVLFGCLILMEVNLWTSLAGCGVLCGVLHLGYGESTPVWGKVLVAISYSLPCLLIGFTWFIFIVPPAFLIMFLLSNIPITSTSFTWRVVEFFTGSLIGCSILTAGLLPWI